jgi:ferrous iron transport protein A
MVPLGLMSPGENGEIMEIRSRQGRCDGSCQCKEGGKGDWRIEDLGLRVGKTVEVLNNAGGPILLKVDETRIAVGRGLAMKILVKEVRG